MRATMIVIPARLKSGRIPKKLLYRIDGETLLKRVWKACTDASYRLGCNVIVAVDDEELVKECVKIGVRWIMTGDCANGTERVARIAESIGYTNGDWVINVQADHADITPEAIVEFSSKLIYTNESYSTLYCAWEDLEYDNDGIVKVIVNKKNEALYFTRCNIPGAKKHSGIYGYTGAFLRRYLDWGIGKMEQFESLEQMRVLENGCSVKCFPLINSTGNSVNVPEDLRDVN